MLTPDVNEWRPVRVLSDTADGFIARFTDPAPPYAGSGSFLMGAAGPADRKVFKWGDMAQVRKLPHGGYEVRQWPQGEPTC